MNFGGIPAFLLVFIPVLLLVFMLVYFATFSTLEQKRLEYLLNLYLGLPHVLLFWSAIMAGTKSSILGWLVIFGFLILAKALRPLHLVDGLTLGALIYLAFSSRIALVSVGFYLIVQLTGKWKGSIMTHLLLFWSGMLLTFTESPLQTLAVLAFCTIHVLGALNLLKTTNQQVMQE
ncbi:hypothetical protein [Thermococcus sp.]